ncbi:MAG TPA: hypothetical protein VKA05_03510, partial [Acidimicrobiales bacterium]|nr:hypothetical protein [Acidimicrobiales bacterium]
MTAGGAGAGSGAGGAGAGPGGGGHTTVSAWHVGTKVVAEGAAAATALLAAAATGDVALVALATPLAIAAVLGLTRRRPQAPVVE